MDGLSHPHGLRGAPGVRARHHPRCSAHALRCPVPRVGHPPQSLLHKFSSLHAPSSPADRQSDAAVDSGTVTTDLVERNSTSPTVITLRRIACRIRMSVQSKGNHRVGELFGNHSFVDNEVHTNSDKAANAVAQPVRNSFRMVPSLRLVHRSTLHHKRHVRQEGDILQRIPLHRHQIRHLADGHAAKILLDSK